MAPCAKSAQGIGFWAGSAQARPGGRMQLKLNTRVEKGVTIVDCNGRIVFGEESALLRDTLKQLIVENSQIVLNLSGISYIDSGGVGKRGPLATPAHNAGGGGKGVTPSPRADDIRHGATHATECSASD